MSHVEGEVCIVTGAARGLGAAFGDALRTAGATVITCDVLPGADAVVDVSDAAQVHQFVTQVESRHGPIGVAVLNAGVCRFTDVRSPFESAVDDFDFHVSTNLRGVFLCGRAVLPSMVAQRRGNVVIIGTDHYCRPADVPYNVGVMDAYDASKWGLLGLVNSWANVVDGKGVRVNALSMGATDSHMLRSFTAIATGKEPSDETIASWMRPEQVAALVLDIIDEGPDGRNGSNNPVIWGEPIVLPGWSRTAEGARPFLSVTNLTPSGGRG